MSPVGLSADELPYAVLSERNLPSMEMKSAESPSRMAAAKGWLSSAGTGSPSVAPALLRIASDALAASDVPFSMEKGIVNRDSVSR